MSQPSPVNQSRVRRGMPARVAAGFLLLGLVACSRPDTSAQLQSAQQRLARGDAPGAVIDARNALARNERSPLGRFTLARALLAAGDLDGAGIELRRAAEFGHPEPEVLALTARLLNLQGRHDEVLDRFRAREPLGGTAGADLSSEVARAHAERRDRNASEAAIAAALVQAPHHAPSLLLRAELLASAGDAAAALQVLDGVLERDPDNAAAWATKGQLLARARDHHGEAAAAYREALARQPGMLAAHTGLLSVLLASNAFEEFARQVGAMEQVLPDHPTTIYFKAVAALQAGDLRAARQGAQSLLRGSENELRVVYLAGLVEARLGNRVQAESLLTRATQIAPTIPEPRRELAALYVAMGQGDRALQTLAPLMAATADDALAWRLAGQAHLRKGDFKAADAAFSTAARLRPDDASVRLDVARSLLGRGQVEAGLRELQGAADASLQPEADLTLVAVHMARNDVAAALRAADAMANKLPESPLPHLVRGRILQAAGDRSGARRAYEAGLGRQPTYMPAVSSLAALDLEDHQLAAARRRYEAVLKADPQQADAMLALAVITRREGGSRADAKRWVDKAVTANPLEPAIWRQAIDHHRRDGDLPAALARAQAAIAAMPNDPTLLAELASAQLAAKEALQAIGSLNRLVQLLPESPDAYLRLAQAQLDAGNTSAARHNVRRATQLAPDWPPTLHAEVALALTLDRDPERALSVARRTQAGRPREAYGWVLEGQVERHRRNWTAATAAYRTALEKQPSPETAIALHKVLVESGNAAGARTVADNWRRGHPEDLVFPAYFAEFADRSGDLAAAESRYRELVGRRPDDVWFVNNLAYVLVRRQSPDALATAERAFKLAPYRPEVLDTLAAAHAERRQFPAAADWQAKAVELDPQNSGLRLALVRYLIAAGRKDKARLELRVLERTARTPEDREAIERLSRELGG
ncbi:MAG: PEP-CTERM system TPR-repeat protein PrsT [Rubrivivax sp.]|nr:PEP-CTERM system TPR-repeat protein PrsT [Rubrivivax sp.]